MRLGKSLTSSSSSAFYILQHCWLWERLFNELEEDLVQQCSDVQGRLPRSRLVGDVGQLPSQVKHLSLGVAAW